MQGRLNHSKEEHIGTTFSPQHRKNTVITQMDDPEIYDSVPGKFKEVLYDNRVLHVRKKFTVPCHILEPARQTIEHKLTIQPLNTNQCPSFRSFVDLIHKNKNLCRRGPCQVPLSSLISSPLKSKRLKTDTGLGNRRYRKDKLASQPKKFSYVELQQVEYKSKKLLPSLGWATQRGKDKIKMPIRVENYVSKSKFPQSDLQRPQQSKQQRNLMHRRLDVEMVNFNLFYRGLPN